MSVESYIPVVRDDRFFNCGVPIIVASTSSLCLSFANEAALRFYGYHSNEVEHINIADIDYRTAAIIARGDSDFKSINSKMVFSHTIKSGAVKQVKLAASYIVYKNRRSVMLSVIDVTELLFSEELLEKDQKRRKFFVETVIDAVILAEGGIITDINSALTLSFGWTKDEIIGKDISGIFEGEGALTIYQAASSAGACRAQALMRNKAGDVINVQVTISNTSYGDSNTMVIMVRDITEFKAMEKTISESRRYVQDILDAQTSLVCIWEKDRMVDCNKSFAKFFRVATIFDFSEVYPVPEIVLIPKRGCVSADAWPEFLQKIIENKLKGKKSKISAQPYGETASRVFMVDLSEMDCNKYVVVMSDVTDIDNYTTMLLDTNMNLEKEIEASLNKIKEADIELQSKEEILIQQSKMAVMGEMIGMIAHQWKQPLNVISVLNQDLQYSFETGELTEDFVENCTNGINRQVIFMTDTINSFANFFKSGDLKDSIKLFSSIRSVEILLAPQFNKFDISIEYSKSGESFEDILVVGSLNGFKQVIMNIFVNAKDAILTSRSKNKDLHGVIKVNAELKGRTVIITFSDNGGGIPEEYLCRVFDRYVTSKGEKGTGIGLHLCKILVRNMGGSISASNNGDCAEFRIELSVEGVI